VQNPAPLAHERLRTALEAAFARPIYLNWYRGKVRAPNLTAASAVDDFLARSTWRDISPLVFFDPEWFRNRFRVDGVNAFVSYLTDDRLRLAPPSPLFHPRWYCRQNGLVRSAIHPLVHYL